MKSEIVISVIVLILFGALVVGMNMQDKEEQPINKTESSNVVNKIESSKVISLDLKDFNRNPEKYIGKEVIVRGIITINYGVKFSDCGQGIYRLQDSEGYHIDICPFDNRDFNFNEGVYTFKGVIDNYKTGNIAYTNPDNEWLALKENP